MLVTFIASNLTISASSVLDLSISKEEAYYSRSEISVLSKEIGSKPEFYTPNNSKILRQSKIDEVTVNDYIKDGNRYIVEYLPNGEIRKTVKDSETGVIYVVQSNKKLKKYTPSDLRKEIQTTTKEEVDMLLEKNKKSAEKNSSMNTMSLPSRLFSSTKEVDPLSYKDYSGTRPFSARRVKSYYTIYSKPLDDAGFYKYTNVKIYNTMDYFVEDKKSSIFFSKDTALSVIAVAFDVALDGVISWISGAGVLFTAYNVLSESCKVINEHSYTYAGGKEATVYDRSNSPVRYVEVYSKWDDGKISLSWDYDSSTGYNNPSWGHTKRANALTMDNGQFKDEALRIYNANITVVGFWKHGAGRLGY